MARRHDSLAPLKHDHHIARAQARSLPGAASINGEDRRRATDSFINSCLSPASPAARNGRKRGSMNVDIRESDPVALATSYPRRFTTVIKWDSRMDVWFAFIPELARLPVCGATRAQAIELAKNAARSFIDRAATDGPPIPPDSYQEILEIEVEVPIEESLTPATEQKAAPAITRFRQER